MVYIFMAIISAVLFGAAAPLSKSVVNTFSPYQLAGILYLGAALGVLPLAHGRVAKSAGWRVDKKNIVRLGIAIICGGIFAPVFLLKGLLIASAASVSLWLPLEMVATAVLGALFFHDYLGFKGWLGMIGVVATSILLGIAEPVSGLRAGLYIFLACLFWGIDNNLTSLIDNIRPAQSTFWKGLVAGTVNLAIGLALQPYQASFLASLYPLLVGAFCYGASILLYINAAQNIGASRAQMFFASNPFFGLILAAIWLRESINAIQGLAAGLMVVSLAIILFSQHEHLHIHLFIEHEHSHSHDDGHHDHKHPETSKGIIHVHKHSHEQKEHSHPHWPDLHHRHEH